MLPDVVGKPIVLLLGEVILAHAEWNALSKIAELRVRRSFPQHCSVLIIREQ